MGASDLIKFPDADTMAERIADLICGSLESAITQHGNGVLAVSGGSTPERLHNALSARNLPWSKVFIIPVDERWVSIDHSASNEAFIQRTLLQGHATNAQLISLKTDHKTPAAGLDEVEGRLKPISRAPDAIVFGMGTDGHTASWFPNARGLAPALDTKNSARVTAITAIKSDVTGEFVDRMTLTLSYCLSSPTKVLLMQGGAKAQTFAAARNNGSHHDMPVRALLENADNLWPCWAP